MRNFAAYVMSIELSAFRILATTGFLIIKIDKIVKKV
jgi:hypothetical protein